MSWTTSRGVIALVAVVALTLLAGCGGSDDLADNGSSTSASASDAASESPSASPTESPSSPSESASETAVADDAEVAAVRADVTTYNEGFTKAARGTNRAVPELIQYSTPRMRAEDRAFLADRRRRGIVLRGEPRFSVLRVTVEGNRATVRLCEFDSAAYYVYKGSGERVEAVQDRWRPYEARAIKRGDHWMVNQYEEKKFSCKGAT